MWTTDYALVIVDDIAQPFAVVPTASTRPSTLKPGITMSGCWRISEQRSRALCQLEVVENKEECALRPDRFCVALGTRQERARSLRYARAVLWTGISLARKFELACESSESCLITYRVVAGEHA